MPSIGVVCNFWNEANSLPGWLECHTAWADAVTVYQSGPGGAESTDGSIEILEKWKIPIHRGKIDDGFGIVRTAALQSNPCDFVMILDCDERFHRFVPRLQCTGESTPPDEANTILQGYDFRDLKTMIPNWENLKGLGASLNVEIGEPYDQVAFVRQILADHPAIDAVISSRRHWHDFTWRKPTQNWHDHPDWQMRIVRKGVHFNPGVRMHEQLMASNPWRPHDWRGPFFDHYHFHFKEMEIEQRAHDVKIYDAIHEGRTPPTLEEFRGQ